MVGDGMIDDGGGDGGDKGSGAGGCEIFCLILVIST